MTDSNDAQQAAAHTPEPWGDNDDGVILGNLDGYTGVAPMVAAVVGYDDDGNATEEAKANTVRIVAAVNACEGIPTEALERGIVGEMLAALQEAREEIEYWHADMLTEEERRHPRGSGWARVYDKVCAVIAKATAA